MGEEGLRPSTPPPFEKGGRKLLCFSADSQVLFKETPERDAPAEGVKNLEQNFYV